MVGDVDGGVQMRQSRQANDDGFGTPWIHGRHADLVVERLELEVDRACISKVFHANAKERASLVGGGVHVVDDVLDISTPQLLIK